tara:strand:+ start:391 stop:720 length:330 start_codon:yes stop_codon:yes gene_type:complete
MIFHITVKNSLENFIEQSEFKGITNLINDLEDIELIGAWQDSLDFSFYFVVKSKSYELIFDLITSNITYKIVFINPVKSIDEVDEKIKTKINKKQNVDYWKNEFETERQ